MVLNPFQYRPMIPCKAKSFFDNGVKMNTVTVTLQFLGFTRFKWTLAHTFFEVNSGLGEPGKSVFKWQEKMKMTILKAFIMWNALNGHSSFRYVFVSMNVFMIDSGLLQVLIYWAYVTTGCALTAVWFRKNNTVKSCWDEISLSIFRRIE